MRANRAQTKKSGFTLIELLIVVSIMSILVATVMVSLQVYRMKSQAVQGLADIQRIAFYIESYRANYGTYPLSCGTGGAWASRRANSLGGCTTNNDCWISGFALEGWCPLPFNRNSPPAGGSAAASQYVYYSNAAGTQYKLIYNQPVSMAVPAEFIDPQRPTSAFGVWSAGGIGF